MTWDEPNPQTAGMRRGLLAGQLASSTLQRMLLSPRSSCPSLSPPALAVLLKSHFVFKSCHFSCIVLTLSPLMLLLMTSLRKCELGESTDICLLRSFLKLHSRVGREVAITRLSSGPWETHWGGSENTRVSVLALSQTCCVPLGES